MKTHTKLTAVILASTVAALVAQSATNSPQIEVVAARQSVRLGEPVVVSVTLSNGTSRKFVASRSATAFDCFEVTGPDGKRLRYIGFDGQVNATLIDVPPLSSLTLAESLDLRDKYLFQQPGRYQIRFSEMGGYPDSPNASIDIIPGRLSDFDELVASLLPICPEGWRLAKDIQGDVTPFGRIKVPGYGLHLCRKHMQGEAVLLWFTKEEAKIDPAEKPRGKMEFLGRTKDFWIYASVFDKTPALWPNAIKDISQALNIPKQ